MKILTNKYGVKYLEHDLGELPEGHEEIINATLARKEVPELGMCNIEMPTSYCKDKVMESPYIHLYNETTDLFIDINTDEIKIIGIDKDDLLSKWEFWNSEIIELEEEGNG